MKKRYLLTFLVPLFLVSCGTKDVKTTKQTTTSDETSTTLTTSVDDETSTSDTSSIDTSITTTKGNIDNDGTYSDTDAWIPL